MKLNLTPEYRRKVHMECAINMAATHAYGVINASGHPLRYLATMLVSGENPQHYQFQRELIGAPARARRIAARHGGKRTLAAIGAALSLVS